jgi:RNase adaptor protein for sRNA GlmZ degradation
MTNVREKTIYFITGASGVGKTTLVNQLEEKYKSKSWMFLHFDQIGVPPIPEMIREFGSPPRWQEAKALEWIDQLINRYEGEKIFFEGQVNLQFIRDGFEKHHFKDYQLILIDCSEQVMEKRLVQERKQPELFNEDMRNWLKFLRNQAKQFGATIIDSSVLSEKELLMKFERAIKT